jgi:enoyl-CoA hydratase
MNKHLQVKKQGAVALVCMCRPPVNALDIEMLDEIDATFAALEDDDSVGAVVLTGEANIFSAGMNLKTTPNADKAQQDEILKAINRGFGRVFLMPKPTIAAVNGHAIAGGMILLLATDYRVAVEEHCQFGLTEVRVGIPFPVAAIEIARAQLSPPTLRDMVLFGRNMGPQAALACGVVDAITTYDDVLTRAMAKAKECLDIPRDGYAKVKQQLHGPSYAMVRAAIDQGKEPALGNWLSDEARTAAAAILARSG